MSLFDVIMKDQQFLIEASVYRGNSINLVAAPDEFNKYTPVQYNLPLNLEMPDYSRLR